MKKGTRIYYIHNNEIKTGEITGIRYRVSNLFNDDYVDDDSVALSKEELKIKLFGQEE